MLFDTHLHVVDRRRLTYPWIEPGHPLDRDSLYEAYQRDALRCGISDVLHMEVDVAPDQMDEETAYLKSLAERPGSLLRGAIAACRPEEADFPAYLERCLADPFVKGLRRVLHVAPDGTASTPRFQENIGRLADTRLTFDLCVFEQQFPEILALVDANPRVTFILDHCANPQIAQGMSERWKSGVADFARRQNVIAKISGVIAYGDLDAWSVDSLRPYVETVIGAFGWTRIVWGSDWPVATLGGGLTPWVAATYALTADCSREEREALYHRNARRIWGLGG